MAAAGSAAAAAAAAERGALAAYRELLRLLRRLPEPQRAPSAASARAELRRGVALTGEAAREAVARLESRVAFLRMATPRAPGGGSGSSSGGGTYVLRDGRLVEGRGRSAGARVGGPPSADEAVRRHAQLVRRQHFGRAPPPYNPRSF
jgi:hypothetical protein